MKDYLYITLIFLLLSCGKNPAEINLPDLSNNQQTDNFKEFSFAVISDLNKSYGSTTYLNDVKKSINYINSNDIPLVLATGDMVAGQKSGLNYQKMWDAFHDNVTHPLKQNNVLFAPSPGNHDASNMSRYEQERDLYKKTFNIRSNDSLSEKVKFLSGSQYPLYYAFNYQNSLFVSLDATNVHMLETKQLEWLKQVLSTSQSKYKIIFGHVPLFPFAYKKASEYLGRSSSNKALELEDLLDKYKVDLFLSGHHHVYYKGHRKRYTKYISVPLLGTGTRSLLTDGQFKSQRGFLVITLKEDSIELNSIQSSNLKEVLDNQIPDYIRVPNENSSTCKNCNKFPENLFLPGSDRLLFLKETSI